MEIPTNVRNWLLEADDPSVRYRTLTQLLGAPQDDPEVQQARAAVLASKTVQKIFAKMHPDGYWLYRGRGAGIEYAMSSSTHFVLAYLAELGLDRSDERIRQAVERYLSLHEPDNPFPNTWQIPPDTRNRQSCLYAYNVRTFILLGYRHDPRIQERVNVLLEDWRADGGYLCGRPSFNAKTKSCIRGTVKALMAFAELPELWESERCKALVDYFLRRRVLYKSGQPGELIRGEVVATVFPFVISASLLEPLYALGRMGYGHHPALGDAWQRLEARRDGQGRYILDHSPRTLFDAGPGGRPNKWVTLYALLALKALETY
ncbi:MAG: hypothetical protein ACOYYS_11485 [Chloroflexota bacterium]